MSGSRSKMLVDEDVVKIMLIPNNTPRCGPPPPYCSPCLEMPHPPPIFGRFGTYFNPSTKRISMQKKKTPTGTYELAPKKPKKPASALLGPSYYQGQHPIMWNPHIRRGTNLVHFSTLDARCDVEQQKKQRARQQRKKKEHDEQESAMKKLFGYKGTVTYPDVTLSAKQETTDYSQFLEEQKEEGDSGRRHVKCQTDSREEDGPSLASFGIVKFVADEEQIEDQNKGCDVPPNLQFRNKFQAGLDEGMQVDYFHLSTDMGQPTNPIQNTIKSVSTILSSQLLGQSLLEEMETCELRQIREECNRIEKWLVMEQLRKSREKRELCKKMERIRKEAELEEEYEGQMDETRVLVGVANMAKCYAQKIVTQGFQRFGDEGMLSVGVDAAGTREMEEWLSKYTTEYVLNTTKISRDLLDEIIEDVEEERNNAYYEDPNAFKPKSMGVLYKKESEFVGEGEDEGESGESYLGYEEQEEEKEEASVKEKGKMEPLIERLLSPRF